MDMKICKPGNEAYLIQKGQKNTEMIKNAYSNLREKIRLTHLDHLICFSMLSKLVIKFNFTEFGVKTVL